MKQDLRPLELEGLCVTCDHAGACGYLARTQGPIWRCEEFDDSGQAQPGPVLAVAPRPAGSTWEPGPTEPLGLCANCENEPTCGLPRSRDGVWFCEEYR